MSPFQTLEAPIKPTFAYYVGLLHGWVFDRILAAGSGTPLSALVEVNERLLKVVLVPLELFRIA